MKVRFNPGADITAQDIGEILKSFWNIDIEINEKTEQKWVDLYEDMKQHFDVIEEDAVVG